MAEDSEPQPGVGDDGAQAPGDGANGAAADARAEAWKKKVLGAKREVVRGEKLRFIRRQKAGWTSKDEGRVLFSEETRLWDTADREFLDTIRRLENEKEAYRQALEQNNEDEPDCPVKWGSADTNPWTASLYIPRLRSHPKLDKQALLHRQFMAAVDKLPLDALVQAVVTAVKPASQEMGLDSFVAHSDLKTIMQTAFFSEMSGSDIAAFFEKSSLPRASFITLAAFTKTFRECLTTEENRYRCAYGCFSRLVSGEAMFKWRVSHQKGKPGGRKARKKGDIKGPDVVTRSGVASVANAEYLGSKDDAPHPNRALMVERVLALPLESGLPFQKDKLALVDFVAALANPRLFLLFAGAVLDTVHSTAPKRD